MPTRKRFMTSGDGGSYSVVLGSDPPITSQGVAPYQKTMTDVTGQPHSDHGLEAAFTDLTSFTPLEGTASAHGNSGTFSSWVPSSCLDVCTHVSTGTLPGVTDQDYTSVVAGTNPSRPYITPLSLIQDLVDLPKMLRDAFSLLRNPGRHANPRGLASNYLGYEFGWLPLVQDLHQLLNVQQQVHRRSTELQNLYSKGGLKRRVNLGSTTAASGPVRLVFTELPPGPCSCHYKKSTTAKRWATIRWSPTSPPPFDSSTESRNREARKLVLGLTPEGFTKGLWDVIPWTWLLGWFSNVGNYMQTYSNSVPASCSYVCVMTHTTTTIQFTDSTLSGALSGGNGSATYETKERVVGTRALNVSMPFLDIGRLSILGALGIQRAKR